MKLALFADVHANSAALEAALKDAMKNGYDHMIFAGDAVGYYPFVNETCDILKEQADWCVKGNHDAFVTGKLPVTEDKKKAFALDYTISEITEKNRAWLECLPESLDLSISGKTIKVFHGSPWNYLEEYIYPDSQNLERFDNIKADYVILGHTHHSMLKKRNGKVIINPGSCGQPRDGNQMASYSILDIETGNAVNYKVSYDTKIILLRLEELKFDKTAHAALQRK